VKSKKQGIIKERRKDEKIRTKEPAERPGTNASRFAPDCAPLPLRFAGEKPRAKQSEQKLWKEEELAMRIWESGPNLKGVWLRTTGLIGRAALPWKNTQKEKRQI
jgi:hypothetical protein